MLILYVQMTKAFMLIPSHIDIFSAETYCTTFQTSCSAQSVNLVTKSAYTEDSVLSFWGQNQVEALVIGEVPVKNQQELILWVVLSDTIV